MKKYIHIAQKIYNTPWYAKPETVKTIAEQFTQYIQGQMPDMMPDDEEDDTEDMMQFMMPEIAVINIDGIIGKRLSMLETQCGGVDVDMIKDEIKAAVENPTVQTIVFNINSPGGTVVGVPELAAFIDDTNKKKKCIAYVDNMCCSAAYYLASQCEAIYTTQTAEIGSVGVYTLLVDESRALENAGIKVNAITNDEAKLKLAGASFKPLTEEEFAYFKEGVQKSYNMFKTAVQSKRPIADAYLDGRVIDGEEAVNLGFSDGIVVDFDELLDVISGTF